MVCARSPTGFDPLASATKQNCIKLRTTFLSQQCLDTLLNRNGRSKIKIATPNTALIRYDDNWATKLIAPCNCCSCSRLQSNIRWIRKVPRVNINDAVAIQKYILRFSGGNSSMDEYNIASQASICFLLSA